MKKTIYKYFFREFIRYFTVVLFALCAVIWSIQAVNFLDLVTDDGHAFKIYFIYSILTIPKILTKLIPFTFLISLILTILKLEKDNELIVLWTSGLNKIHIVNLVLRISLLVMFIQFFLYTTINPQLLNFSRLLIKNSQLQFIPSLLKEKQFNDTVENLTIFVDKKNHNGIYENIFIRDEGRILTQVSSGSSTIFAKSGYISDDEKNLILINGNIQKIEKEGKVSIVKFKKTTLNLSGLSTKTISEPKIQETSTIQIIYCILSQYMIVSSDKCQRYSSNFVDTKIEINKRFGIPIFIPLIALTCCFVLASRKDKKYSEYNKYIYFIIGLFVVITSEIAVRYSGISLQHSFIYYLLPTILFPIFYLTLIRTFKHENLN